MRDAEKREACKKFGITLIEVPYWWDYKKESIVELVRQTRADLIEKMV